MNWMNQIPQNRPLVLGHRGAMAYRPQNTLESFRLAKAQGADGLETDVQLSADGVPLIYHDDTLESLSDGKGRIRDHSWDYLKRLDVGSHFSKDYQGAQIPRLDEFLDEFGESLLLNLEIKTDSLETGFFRRTLGLVKGRSIISYAKVQEWREASRDLVYAVSEALIRGPKAKGYKAFRGILISSFDPAVLMLCREIMPEVPLGFLTSPSPRLVWDTESLVELSLAKDLSAWHPYYGSVDKKLMQEQGQKGRIVQAWTVNDPAKALALKALGCQCLITNVPDLLLKEFGETLGAQ